MPIDAADAMTKAKGGERKRAAQPHFRKRVEIARVGAAIDHASGHGEEQGGDHAVRKHLQHRAAETPSTLAVASPSSTKPMWLTLE